MDEVIGQRTEFSRLYLNPFLVNGRRQYRLDSYAGPIYYRDDNAHLQPVVYGSNDDLPGNCEIVPIANGYRLWKPSGMPPYNPNWLPTDYWLQVEDGNGVTDFDPRRSTVVEQVTLANAGSTRPAWRWTWNTNLAHRLRNGLHEWTNANGDVIFTKLEPRAWSQATPGTVVNGMATLDADGYVTVSINLAGLSYPVILDPTTAFTSSPGDGRAQRSGGDPDWATARAAASSTDVDYTGTDHTIQNSFTPSFFLARAFIPFNTSSIPVGSTVTDVTLTLRSANAPANADTMTAHVVQTGQASINQIVTADYGTVSFTGPSGASLALSVIPMPGNDYTFTFNATGRGFIVPGGNTKLGIVLSGDKDNVTPTGSNHFNFASSESANDPVLSVTYGVPAGPGGGSSPPPSTTVIRGAKTQQKLKRNEMVAALEGMGF